MIIPEVKKLNRELIRRILGLQEGNASSSPADDAQTASLESQISRCSEAVLACASPRAVYKIVPAGRILGTSDPEILLPGDDIRRLLDGCREAVFFALTLGAEVERLLMRAEVTNMSDAFVLDACASAAAEEAADDFERQLGREMREKGLFLTNRYSPGYGDLPLSTQRPLLDLLNAQRAIGLTLTPTNLMVPRKSVTAVMGVCDTPKESVLGNCTHCPLKSKCSFRARGLRCYT